MIKQSSQTHLLTLHRLVKDCTQNGQNFDIFCLTFLENPYKKPPFCIKFDTLYFATTCILYPKN
jgi:hypothetical protein